MIKQLNQLEISINYPSLYEACFDSPSPKSMPSVMLIAEDKVRIFAFSSGYFHNADTFYINSVGMIPKYRTKKNAAVYEKSFHKYYKERMGVKHIMGFVANDNIRTLHVALRTGYLITGVRIASNNKTLVIISKKL